MRALVLGGAGTMGRWVVRDLTESDGVDEVAVADLDAGRALEAAGWAAARAGATGTASVRGLELDAADGAALRHAFAHVDVVCNCAGHATNLRVMEACADAGTHYVDLGGLFHTTREQLTLHDRFVAAGVTAVVGMGASPGTSNVMAALAAGGLGRVDSLDVRVGIADPAPSRASLPVPYSIDTLLDQLSEPAVTYCDGAFLEVPAMSGQEVLDFPDPVGRTRVGHSLHSVLATLPVSFAPRGVRQVSFKLGFRSDFMERMDLLIGLGLASNRPLELDGGWVVPRDLLIRCIRAAGKQRCAEQPADGAVAIWVRARGRRAGQPEGTALAPTSPEPAAPVPMEVLAECVARSHPRWRTGAGQLVTGVPASVVAQFLAHGVVDRPGVLSPEQAVPPGPYFAELARRSVEVTLITRTPVAACTGSERNQA